MRFSCEEMHLLFVKDRLIKLGLRSGYCGRDLDPTSMPHSLHLRVQGTDMWDERLRSSEPRLRTGMSAESDSAQKMARLPFYQVSMKVYRTYEASSMHHGRKTT